MADSLDISMDVDFYSPHRSLDRTTGYSREDIVVAVESALARTEVRGVQVTLTKESRG